MPAYTHHSRVAFADTDASGIVYFAHFFRYAQEAEVYALASLGFTRQELRYPRVNATADFLKPLRFWDEFRTEAELEHIGSTSLHWKFTIIGAAGACAVVRIVTSRRNPDFSPAPYSEAEKQRLSALLISDREPAATQKN